MQYDTVASERSGPASDRPRATWGGIPGGRRGNGDLGQAAVPTSMILIGVLLVVGLLGALGGSATAGNGRIITDAAATNVSPAPANVTPALARLASQRPAENVDVIVQLDRSTSLGGGAKLVRGLGGTTGRRVRLIHALGARMTAAGAVRLALMPQVKAVTVNGKILPSGKPGGRNKVRGGQGVSASRPTAGIRTAFNRSIGATSLWVPPRRTTGRGVAVAVVDTGIAGDLADFQVSRHNKLSRVRVSAVVNPDATNAGDQYGHGTHIAGLIAGNGRSRGLGDGLRSNYSGVAPSAQLVSIKASDDHGVASVLDVIYGIQFAVDHKDAYRIKVLNLSLSSTVADSYLNDPLNAAAESAWLQGIFVVAAAGNSGADPDSVSYAPGNDPYVLSVGAADDQGTPEIGDDKLASWSSRGTSRDGIVRPDVLAPGAKLISTLAPGSDFAKMCPECIVDREYFRAGGTSMAAAVASGAAALLFEAHPDWTPDQMKAALITTARDVPGVGREIAVDEAVGAVINATGAKQQHKTNSIVDAATGKIDYSGAKWRAATWRGLDRVDPSGAKWSAATWRCDCPTSDAGSGQIDPTGAKWSAASWRTSFTK